MSVIERLLATAALFVAAHFAMGYLFWVSTFPALPRS